MPTDDRPLAGRVFAGRYQLARDLRAGATGGTFIATDLEAERQVAVVVLPPTVAKEPRLLVAFRTRANQVAGVDHLNLATVLDWGIDEQAGLELPYVVHEHLGGGSLREMLDRGRLLSPSQALTVGLDASRALDVLHRRGLHHGSVSPKHLVFGTDRRVRLTDPVGSGILADEAWRRPDRVDLERARYAAPEQLADGGTGASADVYALALVLVEAVTGVVPFDADSVTSAASLRSGSLLPVSADLGPLAAVLERAGRPDAAERSTAAEFGAALVQVAQRLPRPAPIPLVGTGLAPGSGGITRPAGDWPAPDTAPDTGTDVVRPPLYDLAADPDEPTDRITSPPTAEQESVPAAARRRVLRRRAGRGFAWLGAAGALVAAAVLGVVAFQALSTKSHPVPELVGRPADEVANLVAEFAWDVTVEEERSDEQEAGRVVRTVPAAGEKLDEGSLLLVVVSVGPTLSELPEIDGRTVADAENLLESRGLVLVVAGLRFDELAPEGSIISWEVSDDPTAVAGAEVVKGTRVNVLVSQGPEPRTMPEIVGAEPAEALEGLEALGLVAVEYPPLFSDDVAEGLVVAQDPEPGATLERGSEVRYSISKGVDLVTMPPLAALDHDGVVAALEDAGLAVGRVTGDRSLSLLGVSVDGSAVRAGDRLRRDTPVDLVYAFPP
jgi:eukaryotic-like serine/threonine-protein kinase